MMVLTVNQDQLALRRVRLVHRVRSRLGAPRLDRRLAQGAAPESSVVLAARSQRLTRSSERHRLADSLQRIVTSAEPASGVRLPVPVDRHAVRASRAELELLIERLRCGALDVSGVAAVSTLLADGSGPLYRDAGRDLRDEVAAAVTASPVVW